MASSKQTKTYLRFKSTRKVLFENELQDVEGKLLFDFPYTWGKEVEKPIIDSAETFINSWLSEKLPINYPSLEKNFVRKTVTNALYLTPPDWTDIMNEANEREAKMRKLYMFCKCFTALFVPDVVIRPVVGTELYPDFVNDIAFTVQQIFQNNLETLQEVKEYLKGENYFEVEKEACFEIFQLCVEISQELKTDYGLTFPANKPLALNYKRRFEAMTYCGSKDLSFLGSFYGTREYMRDFLCGYLTCHDLIFAIEKFEVEEKIRADIHMERYVQVSAKLITLLNDFANLEEDLKNGDIGNDVVFYAKKGVDLKESMSLQEALGTFSSSHDLLLDEFKKTYEFMRDLPEAYVKYMEVTFGREIDIVRDVTARFVEMAFKSQSIPFEISFEEVEMEEADETADLNAEQ